MCYHITSVRHTAVSCRIADAIPDNAGPVIADEEINIASCRMDSVVAKVFNLARGESKKLFARECVFVNGRMSPGAKSTPKEDDVISVRGYGKFIFKGMLGTTKKGRLVAKIARYT